MAERRANLPGFIELNEFAFQPCRLLISEHRGLTAGHHDRIEARRIDFRDFLGCLNQRG